MQSACPYPAARCKAVFPAWSSANGSQSETRSSAQAGCPLVHAIIKASTPPCKRVFGSAPSSKASSKWSAMPVEAAWMRFLARGQSFSSM